jgi:hypothetical protein
LIASARVNKRSPDERGDIRGSSLPNPRMLIEIEGVAALKPQDSGHVAKLDQPLFPATNARRVRLRAGYLDLQTLFAQKCRPWSSTSGAVSRDEGQL